MGKPYTECRPDMDNDKVPEIAFKKWCPLNVCGPVSLYVRTCTSLCHGMAILLLLHSSLLLMFLVTENWSDQLLKIINNLIASVLYW